MYLKLMTYLRLRKGGWWFLVVGILVLGHGIIIYRLSSNMAWWVVRGLVVLVLLKHLGLLESIAFFKRRSRSSTRSQQDK